MIQAVCYVIVGLAVFIICISPILIPVLFLIWLFTSPHKSKSDREVERNISNYPYFEHEFDVSGNAYDSNVRKTLIDHYLLFGNVHDIMAHEVFVKQWKDRCIRYIENRHSKSKLYSEFKQTVDDENAVKFYFIRKYGNKKLIEEVVTFSYEEMKLYYKNILKENNYNVEHSVIVHEKNNIDVEIERRKMTTKLREMIMVRDNYTCQICGKYMPDTVGLEIDHIIPVSKGGKTEVNNLRVLCSRCNRRKYNKLL